MSAYLANFVPSDSNLSIKALPVYWLLCIAPHAVAIYLASQGRPTSKWDNRNPRSGDMKAVVRKRLGEEGYAMYERAEAAHYNSLESFPLIAAAVAFANIAKLDVLEMNTYMVGMTILRVLHQAVYIRTSTQVPTFARTLLWYWQVSWSLRLLWKAGVALS